MHKVDQLNTFYLGKTYQGENTGLNENYVLFPHQWLTTHAFCVGMTGSGKTGLCLNVLEEAALDGIPGILVDPKGDLANLLLQFPNLEAQDFSPWLREDQDLSTAAKQAQLWKEGLAEWGIDGERIAALTKKVSFDLYTPGSTLAKSLSLTALFELPEPAILHNREALQERVSSSVLSLLNLLGLEGDPFQSKAFVFLSNLVGYHFVHQEKLDLSKLILSVQNPPFQQLGAMPLESFYSAKERLALAMKLNTLLASPKWSAWLQGEAFEIKNLLYTSEGKPKMSILSLAHLNDEERMFFVSLLCRQMVQFMRQQGGTSSLRALFYMDEIYGYLPPVENPPSKTPLMTLLKQARAFGIGLVLATQNPVDLDYKALSNCGTWWIGRLQTQRDRERVMAGLSIALDQSVSLNQRSLQLERLETYLAKLPQRVFIQHSVHQNAPILLQTRFCMSYLAGPLSGEKLHQLSLALQNGSIASSPYYQLRQLQGRLPFSPDFNDQSLGAGGFEGLAFDFMKGQSQFGTAEPLAQRGESALTFAFEQGQSLHAPNVKDIHYAYLPLLNTGKTPHYKPYLYGQFRVYYKDTKSNWQSLQTVTRLIPFKEGIAPLDFEQSLSVSISPYQLLDKAPQSGTYEPLPPHAQKPAQFRAFEKAFVESVYRQSFIEVWYAPFLKLYAQEGESEAAFRIRLQQLARERLDEEIEKVKNKYASKLMALEEKIRKAAQAVEREKGQARQGQMDTVFSVGASIFSVLLGGSKSSSGVGRGLARVGRSASRVTRQQGDVKRSEESYQHYREQYAQLEEKILDEVEHVRQTLEEKYTHYEAIQLTPAKKDVSVECMCLVYGE